MKGPVRINAKTTALENKPNEQQEKETFVSYTKICGEANPNNHERGNEQNKRNQHDSEEFKHLTSLVATLNMLHEFRKFSKVNDGRTNQTQFLQ